MFEILSQSTSVVESIIKVCAGIVVAGMFLFLIGNLFENPLPPEE
jgi:hypothetical protein